MLSITGPQQYESVLDAVHRALPPAHNPHLDLVPPQGIKLTPRHYAYLKISEGCNNRCTFCIIPKLRGDLVSRPVADVLREAEKLVEGRRQGTAGHLAGHLGLRRRYQIRRRARGTTARSAPSSSISPSELGELGAWVRLQYVYPYPHVDEVIGLMSRGQGAALSRHPVPARAPRTC